jgi:hypothetical protein
MRGLVVGNERRKIAIRVVTWLADVRQRKGEERQQENWR